MNNTLLIHYDNVPRLEEFKSRIKFDIGTSGVDEYISNTIIGEIRNKSFELLIIKDSLSDNYLDLFGLRLALHIRLSQELGRKSLVPILILSDLNGCLLNKLSPSARILFTKNTYISPNSTQSIESFQKRELCFLTHEEFAKDFLDQIMIEAPKDTTRHSIANEWAIYRWADYLNINDSKTINQNKAEISSKLYFKYLVARYPLPKKRGIRFAPTNPATSGKILYIDDQWNLGWQEIFGKYLGSVENIDFKTLREIGKDTQFNELKELVRNYIDSYDPDLIILDMRLVSADINTKKPKNISGIKLLKMIREEISPGIQVIMLTASGQSLLLDKANQYNILGYIKKEHPEDQSLGTKESFNLLKKLIDEGLERKYLKMVWKIQQKILGLPLLKNEKYKPIKIEIESVFTILDSDMKRNNIYATLAIYKCIEIINNIFIHEDYGQAYWNGRKIKIEKIDGKMTSSKNKIINILHKRLSLNKFDKTINNITKKRNKAIHSSEDIYIQENNILDWFKMLSDILEKLDTRGLI